MEQNTFNSNNIDAGSKIASFRVKQSMPYEFKVNYALKKSDSKIASWYQLALLAANANAFRIAK